MDIEKLIERLNNHLQSLVAYSDPELAHTLEDAATALSTLQAENEKLRAEVESLKKGHCAGCSIPAVKAEQIRDLTDAPKLRAELEQVKRERDAIEQDFRAFAKQWWEEDGGFPCRWCKFENSSGCEWKAKQPDEEKICAGREFEWRGPQKED